MRVLIWLVVVTALPVAARGAEAVSDVDTEVAKQRFELGDTLYRYDRYAEAVIEFEAANRLKPTPSFDYNIARCHERMRHWREALDAYKRYVESTPTPLDAEVMLDHMHELEKMRDDEAKRLAALPPAPPPATAASSEPRRHTPGRAERIAGAVLAGFGVASLGAGVGFGVLGNSTADSLTQLSRNNQAFDPALDRNLGSQRTLEGAFLGVGAVALTAGVVTYVIGHLRSRRAHSSTERADAGLGVRF